MFCICTQALEDASICTSALDHFTNVNGDKTPNVTGQYSTSGTNVSIIPATLGSGAVYGQGSPGWSNTSGVLDSDSSSYAFGSVTQQPGQVSSGTLLMNAPTDYLTVSGFGFQIPADATIVAILYGFSSPVIYTSLTHGVPDGSASLWNIVTTCQGNNYYWRDPNSTSANATGVPGALGVAPASPWPGNDFYKNGVVQNSTTVGITYTAAYYAFGQPLHCNVTSPTSGGIGKGSALNFGTGVSGSVTVQRKSPLGQGRFAARAYGDPFSDRPSTSSTLMDTLPQGWLGSNNWSGCNAYDSPTASPVIYGETAYYLGPLAKGGFPMTPTKTSWTPDEVNDPTFGVGVSQLTTFVRAYSAGLAPQIIDFALGGISVAVYYVGGSIIGNPFANCTGVEFQ